jgi:F-type H+-transporting ATPase subunit delta
MQIQANPVSRVYAEALFRVAKDRGVVADIDQSLQGLAALLHDNAVFRDFLAAPMINASRKKVAVKAAMQGNIDELLVDFLCLLIDKGRDKALEGVAVQFSALADSHAGRVRIAVKTSQELSQEQRSKLTESLQQILQSECSLETKVEPEILGGMILRIGDKLYDGSVRRQLQLVGDQLMRSSGYED